MLLDWAARSREGDGWYSEELILTLFTGWPAGQQSGIPAAGSPCLDLHPCVTAASQFVSCVHWMFYFSNPRIHPLKREPQIDSLSGSKEKSL